jgi:tetratricopeptide (TPR) repeat protein
MNLGKYNEAVEDCRSSLRIKPDYPKVIKRLVQGLISLGEMNDAKICVEQGVELNQENKKLLAPEVIIIKGVQDTQDSIDKAVQRKTWSSALYFTNEKLRLCPGDKN